MFGCRSATVAPIMRHTCNTIKTKIESNHRIWLKLILSALIPLMIGVFTIVTSVIQHNLSVRQRNQDKHDASLLRQQSERHADNLQKESVLVTYLNDVSNLLILENESKTFTQIRTKTLTSLRQLDSERKRYLLLFLCESILICQNPQQLNSSSLLKMNQADFNGVQFNGSDDNKCSFTRFNLYDVYLSDSSFIDCYIDRSNLSHTTMNKVTFYKGLLIRTSFKLARMKEAKFRQMKLSVVDFTGALLSQSDFTGTVWDNATVDFTNANLTQANLSEKQLKNSTLDNCILPDGTWGPIRSKNLVVNGDINQNCTSDDGRNLTGWSIPNGGELKVFPNKNQNLTNLSKCFFRIVKLNNINKAESVIQSINLEHYSHLILSNVARYNASASIQCFGKEYITITLYFIDSNGLRYSGVSKGSLRGTHLQTLELSNIIRSDVSAVQIQLAFINSRNNMNTTFAENDCRCYNVNFSIRKA